MTVTAPEADPSRADRWPCTCLGWEAVVELGHGALTYRQLHYWTQHGQVQAQRHHNATGAHITGPEYGSGTRYGWQPGDAGRIATAAQLVKATGMRIEPALILARDGALTADWFVLRLAPAPPSVSTIGGQRGGELMQWTRRSRTQTTSTGRPGYSSTRSP